MIAPKRALRYSSNNEEFGEEHLDEEQPAVGRITPDLDSKLQSNEKIGHD